MNSKHVRNKSEAKISGNAVKSNSHKEVNQYAMAVIREKNHSEVRSKNES